MRRCTVNSSDLAYARVISHRMSHSASGLDWALASLTRSSEPEQAAVPVTAARPAIRTPSDPLPMDFAISEIDSWEVLLAWAIELCQARAAFVVDAQGFVISSRGNPPSSGFEGIGAELCFAMEQLDRLDPESGDLEALELHFGPTNILGIKVLDQKRGAFTLGFVGPRSVHESVRDAVFRQTTHNLDRLG